MNDMDKNTAFQACHELMLKNGGRVVAKYSGDFDNISIAFHQSWLVEHHEALSMITLELPSYGCYSLMHPAIEFWEIERYDIQPLEESE
jgi:hypothetical protein